MCSWLELFFGGVGLGVKFLNAGEKDASASFGSKYAWLLWDFYRFIYKVHKILAGVVSLNTQNVSDLSRHLFGAGGGNFIRREVSVERDTNVGALLISIDMSPKHPAVLHTLQIEFEITMVHFSTSCCTPPSVN